MKKRMLIMLGSVGIFLAIISAVKVAQIQGAIEQASKSGPPPPAVSTAIATRTKWQPAMSAVGSLKAVNGVTISTDLAGIVSEIAFQSGGRVKKGDLLIKLDSQQEQAQLRSAQARRDLAKINFERHRHLVKDGAVSRSAYDTADSELRQAVAAVDEARALIARKAISAPFDGLLGIRQVDLGQYINVGAEIVRLESVDPIYVEFATSQQNLDQIAIGKKVLLRASGLTGEEFAGEITAVDSRLDEATSNIMVQGTVGNEEGKLRPGMFVNVDVLLPEIEVLSIPASSVSYAPYGDSVFVVSEGKAQQRFVKLGETRGDQVAVLTGVNEGDEVVSSGVFKLQSGMPVKIDNSVQPGNEAEPTPPNH
jgi:membrane fusion protein (multidrug efflux system)